MGAAVVEAVSGFYGWYLDYTASGGYVVADRAYRDSPFLTRRLVQSVDALVANVGPGEGWGDDPFLQARGIPARISLELVTTARHSATVLVGVYYGVNPLPRRLAVRLTDEDGLWKLDDIRQDDVTPAGVVQRLYDAYRRGVPLSDHVDCVPGPMGDPFTRGAETPLRVDVLPLWQTRRQAQVLVERWFHGQATPSPVVARLESSETCWQIVAVEAAVEPQMAALGFYQRYLAAVSYSRAHGLPLVNLPGALRFPDYMTLWQVEEIRPYLNDPTPPAVDPVLNTARLPRSLHAELAEMAADRATVLIDGLYPDGRSSSRHEQLVVLDMVREGDRWLIANIRPR